MKKLFYSIALLVLSAAAGYAQPNPPVNPMVGVETYRSLYVKWTVPSGGASGYLVVRGTSDPATAPTNGTTYSAGNAIGTGTVIYASTLTYVTDLYLNGTSTPNLARNTAYYYRIYSYDASKLYSTAVLANGTTKTLTANVDFRFNQSNAFCDAYDAGSWPGGGAGYHTDDCDCWSKWTGAAWDGGGTCPCSTCNAYIESGQTVEGEGLAVNDLVIAGTGYMRLCHNNTQSYVINGNFKNSSIQAGGGLDIITTENNYGLATTKAHTFTVYGNFINYGTVTTGRDRDGSASNFYAGQRIPITLRGNTNTTFPGPGTLNLMWDLEINKTAAANTVTLDNDVLMKKYYITTSSGSTLTTSETALIGELKLTMGKLVLGSYDITLDGAGTAATNVNITQTATETNSYIVTNDFNNATAGKVVLNSRPTATAHKFPIGPTVSDYNPCWETISAGPIDNLAARVETGIDPPIVNTVDFVDRTWFLEEGTAGGNTFTGKFQWNLSDENVNFTPNRTNAAVYHYVGSAFQLESSSGLAGANPYTLNGTGITSFSPFIIGITSPILMPIELLSLTAKCEGDNVRIDWATATEENNDYFTIERSKDKDGLDFKPIGTIKGAGNSSTILKYEFVDTELPIADATAYYRLKQTDYNGKYEYYGPLSVSCNSTDDWNLVLQNLYVQDELFGTFQIFDTSQVQITIYDIHGRKLITNPLFVTKGSNLLKIDLRNISDGIYFFEINSNEKQLVKKFIKL